jgi:nucleotide-binding universal stress UspA family protein
MVAIRRILVHVGDAETARGPLRLATALAAEHAAEVVALHAVEPASAAFLTPEVSAIAVEASARADHARRATAEARVHESAPGATLLPPGEPTLSGAADAVIAESRGADLLVVSQTDPARPDGTRPGFASRVLVGAACPVLFVPYVDWTAGLAVPRQGCGQRVLVAWSDARESARALRDALPLLVRARHVELVRMVDGDDARPGQAVETGPLGAASAFLRRHGVDAVCTVRPAREPSLGERLRRAWVPDASVAESLLSHCADVDADLVVMGGYGHSRAWELALGGVTRSMLQTMTVPVLMSH